MRFLTLIFGAFLIWSFQNPKDKILGAWEFSRPTEFTNLDANLNEIENAELGIWMKFTKDSVIFFKFK